MKKQVELSIHPNDLHDEKIYLQKISRSLHLDPAEISTIIPVRRSIDARKKIPIYRILFDIYFNEEPESPQSFINYENVDDDKKVLIVGFGPAGMFASLKLLELGIKPIVIERGKDVQTRRRDLKAIQQDGIVNPDSNYCFGEGGAGTYSDGKLYTRSTKRGDVKKILDILIDHGAEPDIKVDAHPHIGSNKLPKIVEKIRNTILNNGGEILFESKVTDLILEKEEIKGVVLKSGEKIFADTVILAVGHSARDIYHLLGKKKILIEPKSFAMGVRIEHPQQLINEIQYNELNKHPNLPPASYNLACNLSSRGIYSFCMCPGGIIVPSATSPGEIVVNGMSLSRRDSPFANSGIVVEIKESDWIKTDSDKIFGGLDLQQKFEQKCFELSGETQKAPAQRLTDFINNKYSSLLPDSSYIPGLTSVELHNELPVFIKANLKRAIKIFDKKMKGYFSEEAIITAPESRTSSPIRIPRDKISLMHTEVQGLFPAGEGAGYAGGIISAAIDGENCATAAAQFVLSKTT